MAEALGATLLLGLDTLPLARMLWLKLCSWARAHENEIMCAGMQLVTLDVVEAVEAFASIPSALPALIESMLPQLKMALEVRATPASSCTRAGRDKRSRGRCLWALPGHVLELELQWWSAF